MAEQPCATTMLAAPMDRGEAEDLARLLKAIADPARLQVMSLLRSAESGEACVCDLTSPLGLSQSTVSHHLKGTWSYYSLLPEGMNRISDLLA